MKHRILAIDDDKDNLLSTEGLLDEWGYGVDTAQSGEEGLKKILERGREYSVILLDYQMPLMNGAETASKIRENNCQSIILIYSCDTSRAALKKTYRLGIFDFIDKDENIENLKHSLELACKRYEEDIKLHKPVVNKAHNAEMLRSVGMIGHSQKMAEVVQKCLNYRNFKR